MTRCRDEYEALGDRSPVQVARLLARNGARFDEELRRDFLEEAFPLCEGEPWFVPAALLALRWSRHAWPTDEGWGRYFATGRRFLHGEEVLEELLEHAGRFGPAGLSRALQGYRALFTAKRRDLFETWPASPAALRANQEELIHVLGATVLEGAPANTIGIGPWLGLAAHKILLIWERDWWHHSATDEVFQPLGSVVTRGIRMLARAEIIPANEARLLPREEVDRAEAFGTVVIAQGIQRQLARLADSRVMHINSGLYELGYDGPE